MVFVSNEFPRDRKHVKFHGISILLKDFYFPNLFSLVETRISTSTNGCVVIFVYMTYTMLPVRLREALFGGILLSATHIYLSINNSTFTNWKQVIISLVDQF